MFAQKGGDPHITDTVIQTRAHRPDFDLISGDINLERLILSPLNGDFHIRADWPAQLLDSFIQGQPDNTDNQQR